MQNNERPTRVLIVDDHPMVRRGFSQVIGDEPDLVVCGEAATVHEALDQIEATRPHVVIVDITLGDGNGLDLLKRIKTKFTEVKSLVISMHEERLYAERCFRAGALGYLNKEEPSEHVLAAIRNVIAGRMVMSDDMNERLLRDAVSGRDSTVSSVESLSDRELEVFGMIGRGLTTRDIADRLHLSTKTIETHRDRIKHKLAVDSSAELVRHAVQWVLEGG